MRTKIRNGKNLLRLSTVAFLFLFTLMTVDPVYAAGRNLVGKATTTTASKTANSGSAAQSAAGSKNSNPSTGSRKALQATTGTTTAATVTNVNTGDEEKYIPYIMTMALSAAAAAIMGNLKVYGARKRSASAVREEMEAFRRSCGM